jgi:cyclophilin family peptidyl-prolyl cis-trans isomerase
MLLIRRFAILSVAGVMIASVAPAVAQDAPSPSTPVVAPLPTPAPRAVAALVPTEVAVPENMLALDLSTGGRVIIQLRPDAAPNHVERIKSLVRQGFYNGLTFHRVIEGFMAQGGDPVGNGTGGSSLPNLSAEFNTLPHVRGTLSMARAQSPDSANSQFFIMLFPRLSLDRNYTALGRVVSGMEFVDRIQRGEPPATPSRIVQASIMADNRPMPPASALVESVPAAAPITIDQLNAPLAAPTTPPGGGR